MDSLTKMPPGTVIEAFGVDQGALVVFFGEAGGSFIQKTERRYYYGVPAEKLAELRTLEPMQAARTIFKDIHGRFPFLDVLVPEYVGFTDNEDIERIAAERRAKRAG